MPHARKQIRDAVVTLVTGLATTGTTVSSSKVYAHSVLPSLNVLTPAEALIREDHMLGTKQGRRIALVVEARVKAATGAEDTLDQICAEVETAVIADTTLGGLAQWVELVGTELDFDGESEQKIGKAEMTFEVDYRVDGQDPTTIIG